MDILRSIVKVFACAVYTVLLVALLLCAPVALGYQPVSILSGSMLPTYTVGGITYYHAADFGDIAVGDVITFALGEDSLATHRVIAINEADQSMITQGDANQTPDANPVLYAEMQGKTVGFAVPYAGYFLSALKTLPVMVACGVVVLCDLCLPAKKAARTPTEQPTTPAAQ